MPPSNRRFDAIRGGVYTWTVCAPIAEIEQTPPRMNRPGSGEAG